VLRLLCDLLLRALMLTCGGWDFWQEYTLRGHSDWISSVAYSPDGEHIVSGSNDCTVKIWGAATGEEVSYRASTLFLSFATACTDADVYILSMSRSASACTSFKSLSHVIDFSYLRFRCADPNNWSHMSRRMHL
jgi:WD40 repeat protein